MKSLLIEKGRIIDPSQGIDGMGSLLITDGKIVGWGAISPKPEYDVLPVWGMIVCPGFVDLHCHLRQPGYENKETIATGTRAAAKGGFTTVCCMPNTNPPLDSREAVDYIKAKGVIRVLPIGCVTIGRKGEELVDMVKLAGAGVIGFSDDGAPVKTAKLMRRALEYSRALNLPVIDHCEDTTLTEGGQINDGMVSRELKLPGMPAVAEEKIVARDLDLAASTGGWLHIAHVSTVGSVELICQAKKSGVRVTAEATPHHLTLTEMEAIGYNTNAKVSPPLRTPDDNKALVQGLKEGVIDIIATDHAPHAASDKNCEFVRAAFGISVFETALGSLMSLVHEDKIDLKTLIARLTRDPAKILNKGLGTLKIGVPADVTIFDPNREWLVDTQKFVSKGKNTPLAGKTLKGKVMATIYNGNFVYRDEIWQRKQF